MGASKTGVLRDRIHNREDYHNINRVSSEIP